MTLFLNPKTGFYYCNVCEKKTMATQGAGLLDNCPHCGGFILGKSPEQKTVKTTKGSHGGHCHVCGSQNVSAFTGLCPECSPKDAPEVVDYLGATVTNVRINVVINRDLIAPIAEAIENLRDYVHTVAPINSMPGLNSHFDKVYSAIGLATEAYKVRKGDDE